MSEQHTSYYLVLIETSGNQQFIFSTNRLRENIGASELTYQAGTRWVVEAIAKPNDATSLEVWKDSKRLRNLLRDRKINPPIEKGEKPVEILTAASGKALLLTQNEDTAKKIISKVTRKALIEAPGLDVSGVYQSFEWNEKDSGSLAKAIEEVHKEFEKVRSRRPSPENRFLRLPIVASCAVSGLPASVIGKDPLGRPQSISKVSHIKRKIAPKGIERLQEIAKPHQLAKNINKLEKIFDSEDMPWVAIVHADGNGLGQIFLNFQKYIGKDKTSRNYINKYREFSLTLDECTEEAFRQALEQVLPKNKEFLPIVPLIIGGDDLTVLAHGEYALEFTRVFLQQFEKQTQNKLIIAEIAREAFGVSRLSACAGIAIVKRHFPFSVAYYLAEQLIKSAKEVKQKVTCVVTNKIPENTPFPCSAIDFHILYDTSGVDLSDLRAQLEPEKNTQLYNRPYIVSDHLEGAEGKDWIELHRWELLRDRIHAFNNDKLSSSQSHALRTALFINKEAASSQYKLIQQRYDLETFTESKTESDKSVFHHSEGIYSTSFLDALDAKDFLKNARSSKLETETGAKK